MKGGIMLMLVVILAWLLGFTAGFVVCVLKYVAILSRINQMVDRAWFRLNVSHAEPSSVDPFA